MAPKVGCGSPYYNQCWCSSINIASSATKWVASCITSGFLDNIDVTTAIGIYYDYCSSAGFPIQTLPYQQQSTYQVASPTPVRIILTSPALSLSTRTTALEQDIQLGQRMLYRPQLHWRLSFKRRLPLFHRVRALQPLLYQERQP